MANVISPNMSLIIPGVGTEDGPQYATDINNSLTIIDQHNHSIGSGVQITPSGLNINSSLPMNNNSLTLTSAVTFQAQLTDATNLSLYTKGVDFYLVDGNGNVIRLTQSGSVSGSSGTITGLPSGTASASFGAGTFVFQASTNTAANIDGGSFILRNNTASSFGLTLQPPNALASNFAITLPSIPAQTNVMTLDASGNMGSITYDAVGQAMTSVGANAIGVSMTATGANAVADSRTRTVSSTVGAGGVAKSSIINASITLTTFTDVGTITITTTGRPVCIAIMPFDNTEAYIDVAPSTISKVRISQGTTDYTFTLRGFSVEMVYPASLVAVDTSVAGAAGTYTYNVAGATIGGTLQFVNCVMVAYEL